MDVDRIRLGCAPHMKRKYLLSNGAQLMDTALEHFRRVAKQTEFAGACCRVRTGVHLRVDAHIAYAIRTVG